MTAYILRRLLLMIPTLIGISFLVFMLIALSPGGIGAALMFAGGQAEASSRALQEAYFEDRYGLDAPAPMQYLRWLERISPIKFGSRDLVSPTGERLRPPRPVNPPPLWDWFIDELPPEPGRVDFAFDEGATDEERARIYRRAANDYAQARAGFIAARTMLDQVLVDYARAAELPQAIDRRERIQHDVLARVGPDQENEHWDRAAAQAAAMFPAYERAMASRAHLAAVFRAEPFPKAGIPVIPGMLSLSTPDMGTSFSRGRPVMDLVRTALPVTLLINLIAFPIIYLIAIPSGMLAATKQGSWIDIGSGAFFVALWSIPVVWAGVLAIGFLASNDYLGWFPVSGLFDADAENFRYLPSWGDEGQFHRGLLLDLLWHITLPVACLVYTGFAILSKQTRAAMLDNFNADYVRTAKAKGVASRDIIFRHVFRNSLLPLITIFATLFPALLSGSVVIERIFSVPGMGSLIIEAIYLRDREVILAVTLMIGGVNLLALLLADILYALADPRITYN